MRSTGVCSNRANSLSAGGRKYDDVAQVSKPAVSPTSQSADRPLSGRLRIWKSARQQVWKPALQNTSPNWRPGALGCQAVCLGKRPHVGLALVLRHWGGSCLGSWLKSQGGV